MKNISLIALLSLALVSCEKVIQLDIDQQKKLVYVDGFITSNAGTQTIKLLESKPYLDTDNPVPVSNAVIKLTDITSGTVYDFTYQNGAYNYTPPAATSIGVIGHRYKLSIEYNGATFEAIDVMNRVPPVDSITYEFKEASGNEEEGYYAKFWAKDIPGGTDYYWIRAFRNGQRNTYVTDAFSVDGSYDANISDGFEFIYPIREGITSEEKPYVKGDVVKVTIRSLSPATYDFIDKALNQVYNGGLFARVLENIPSNLQNKTAGSNLKLYGWFGAVGESEASRTIQ